MKKIKFNKYYLVLIFLIALIALISVVKKNRKSDTAFITDIKDIGKYRIGVQTGTSYEEILKNSVPESNFQFFSLPADEIIALKQHKIDCFISESVSSGPEIYNHPWLVTVPGKLSQSEFAIAVGRNEKSKLLLSQINEFIADSKQNGFSNELKNFWIDNYNPKKRISRDFIFSEDATELNIAVESGYEPFSFIGDGEIQGFDIEFIKKFCEKYGYRPVLYEINFDSIVPGLETGKFDLGMNLIVTEERSKSVQFSDPYIVSDIVVITGNYEDSTDSGSMSESFHRTFIEENRWKLFLQGAEITFLITIISLIAGSISGFLLFLAYKDAKDDFKNFVNEVSKIVHGSPTVVFLMIFYYVVFGHSAISGVVVSCIAFSIIFCFATCGLIDVGNKAVGTGQMEAARALGYRKNKAFFKIIFPQAAEHFLPLYKDEVIGLIKETSVVGYIAVQDLTKISDIVRSRTFESLFPLISTALIYFLIIYLLTALIKRIELQVNPYRRREKILKSNFQN